MSAGSAEGARGTSIVSADRILGLLLIILAALVFWSAQSLIVPFAADPLGPKGFPYAVAVILAICGALILLERGPAFAWPERRAAPFLLVLAMVAYALLLETLGFILATTALALGVALLFGAGPWPALATGAVTGLALWALFDKLLDLPLPQGPIRGFLGA
ncbi:tripartite tricarboxylate transporter TctB family protein [Roseococcus sp. SYP-B2431]|uniref:tripartite tricarboxylate transporter TctB family protein n=1 Tax=Roseococcus sp. SYP-B2431 TaxID=2496640 RepID=UPI00103F3031|nr:tripartite tricarboxylate transporter TctB family protein [Roseococcus sp. SYP-B2431]TCH99912.1 tripartite tricarboxylate transporter TctB family protein [Roseococcus sp. SYP-B2431]